jgi:NhaP-type Na+/H+ or K+/H+ antiporter
VNGVQILLIVGVGIAVSALARRRHIEPGLIIVVLAAGVSFIPGVPHLELDSELILAVVVPPLLYSATRGASFAGFGANLRAITTLGVVLVLLTAGALGLITQWLLPSIGVAAAFVLGSVLAPPDTITTVSHGAEIGLPQRVTTILTGESLVNDATALTLFTIAVGAVNGEHTSWQGGAVDLLRNAVVGLAIGALLAVVALWIRKRLGNPTLETSLVLLVPFTAFLAAEQAHASGILAVVAAAFALSVNLTLDPKHQVVFRMVVVYLLFGRWTLRLHLINRRLAQDPKFKEAYDVRRKRRTRRGGEPLDPPTTRETLLVGWTRHARHPDVGGGRGDPGADVVR